MASNVPSLTDAPDAPQSQKRGQRSGKSRAKLTRAGEESLPEIPTSTRKKKPATSGSSTATRNPKTATPSQSTEIQPPTGPNGGELLSLSKLAEVFELDRAVVRRRLNEKEIKPVVNEPKKKLYELTPELEEAIEQNTRRAELDAVEQELDIEWKKTRLQKAHGQLVEFDKAADTFTKVAKGLYDRFIQYATKAGPRLHKCKSQRDLSLALRRDFEKIFGELRIDFRRFIK
jgi:hypothetical protein